MKTNAEKANAIFELISDLDINGKAKLIDVIAQKMTLDFKLKDVREDHLRQRCSAANTRLLKDTVKIFAYCTTEEDV